MDRSLKTFAFALATLLAATLQPLPAAHAGGPQQSNAKGAAASRAAKLRAARLRLKRPFRKGLGTLPSTEIATIDGYSLVAEAEYTDLRNAVKEALTRYPADQHFFVGLGRDPAPIIGFLQNLGGEELAINFPASGSGTWDSPSYRPSYETTLPYFQELFPESVVKGNRNIVLLDQTNAGRTLRGFPPYAMRYLNERGFKGKVIVLAFSPQAQESGIEVIDTNKYPSVSAFLWHPYEGVVSEYDSHIIGTTPKSELVQRPQYLEFKRAMGQRMERDADLDTFLAKNGALGRLRPAPPPKPWKPAFRLKGREATLANTSLLTLRNPGFAKAQEKAKKKAEKRAAAGEDAEAAEEGGDKEAEEDVPETFDYLSPVEYGQLRTATLALMRKHPPKKSFYVGVGRTSTAMVAFLENMGGDIGTYLPADGIHKLASKMDATQLDAGTRSAFYQLFDKFLPSRLVDGGRDVVLFQQSDTGSSLPFVKDVLENYLTMRGSSSKVHVVALAKEAPASGVPHISTSRSGALVELNGDKAKAIAPYPYNRPGHGDAGDGDGETGVLARSGKPRPRSKAYGVFKSALGVRMKADAPLLTGLAKLFGE